VPEGARAGRVRYALCDVIRCPACSSEISELARFCASCGQPLSSISQAPTGLATPSVAEAVRRAAGSGVVRVGSVDSIDTGGFAPGTVLGGRYRVIGLLGRGGMGEVYRADDLKLGQPVALKFLPEVLATDAVARERFYSEVRLARQVSHPNVCRVYDLADIEGRHCLSMEYVDGEDLSSLLKRIGRLPQDKALEIARQLCAGLAAAHDRGVLHRDLKPSNVMIDGRGRVRITDFGLAVASGAAAADGETSGTPAYMAPEQLDGKSATVQSDLYALGLVLYEISTGRRAFDAGSFEEFRRKHSQELPKIPSRFVAGFDPAVERVILKCLEKDPRLRPSSAIQVASTLPGGDPLAAALAAGETPSPEMVAAAGEEGALAPPVAWGLIAAVVVVVAIVVGVSRYSTDLALGPPGRSPDSLADRARDLVRQLGYAERPADSSWWFSREYEYLRYRALEIPSPKRIRELATGEPGPWSFFYRQSPRVMVPTAETLIGPNSELTGMVSPSNPPNEISGMVTVNLDASGRLRSFRALPPDLDEPASGESKLDWEPLFREADLDPRRFRTTPPRWVPTTPYDSRGEWEGTSARHPETPLHLTAAGYRGKPVYFAVAGPWDRPFRREMPFRGLGPTVGAVIVSLIFTLLIAGVVLARRNLRLGRGDRRGAFRIATYVFLASVIAWLLRAHHVPDLLREGTMFSVGLGGALYGAAFVWLSYVALEPYVRRRWPDLLISWNRLLTGRLRDPLVGRDFLVGALLGATNAMLLHLSNALPAWIDAPGMTPIPPFELMMRGTREAASFFFARQNGTVFAAVGMMFLFFLVSSIFRRKWLGAVPLGLLFFLMNVSGENVAIEFPFAVLMAILLVFVVLRFGLLAVAVGGLVAPLLTNSPITLDFSRWYAGRSLFALAVVAAIALYGFRVALGRRPVFGVAALED
jgi:protein kinase-like protein